MIRITVGTREGEETDNRATDQIGAVMVAKCSNPSCSARFRRLKEGKLFRLETDPLLKPTSVKVKEYFWLCRDCSLIMTLRLGEDAKVSQVLLPKLVQHNGEFISVNRQKGLLLREVSFWVKRDREDLEFTG
ncbi:MAG TPA: hypothetical protein VN950_13890 [Terriglobales bacterium]|nr:hypothetical protein [Terriglobales bacterium]